MPTCFITLSEEVPDLSVEQLQGIRDIVASGLNSSARRLDRGHIVIRIIRSQRCLMLGQIELEIFAQFFIQRFFSRDTRAETISRTISTSLGYDCATWINMSIVGYARVTVQGRSYFSD